MIYIDPQLPSVGINIEKVTYIKDSLNNFSFEAPGEQSSAFPILVPKAGRSYTQLLASIVSQCSISFFRELVNVTLLNGNPVANATVLVNDNLLKDVKYTGTETIFRGVDGTYIKATGDQLSESTPPAIGLFYEDSKGMTGEVTSFGASTSSTTVIDQGKITMLFGGFQETDYCARLGASEIGQQYKVFNSGNFAYCIFPPTGSTFAGRNFIVIPPYDSRKIYTFTRLSDTNIGIEYTFESVYSFPVEIAHTTGSDTVGSYASGVTSPLASSFDNSTGTFVGAWGTIRQKAWLIGTRILSNITDQTYAEIDVKAAQDGIPEWSQWTPLTQD